MQKQKLNEIAKSLFETYGSVNAFFITEDGQAFENESNAVAHSRTLEGKPEPVKVNRDGSTEETTNEKKAKKENGAEKGKKAAEGKKDDDKGEGKNDGDKVVDPV